MKRRLLASMLLMVYLLSGCKGDKKNASKDKEEQCHQYYSQLMEDYMEYDFIKDLGLYNEEHPEYYTGEGGLLTSAFASFTGGIGSTQNYYFDLIAMYNNGFYEKDEYGNITFHWDKLTDKNSSIAYTSTELYCLNEGSSIVLVDTVQDGTKYTRNIKDDRQNFFITEFAMEQTIDNNISLKIESELDNYLPPTAIKERFTNKITINFYGKTYEFFYKWLCADNNNISEYVMLPDEEISEDKSDIQVYFNLVNAINSGDASQFMVSFKNYLLRKECLELFNKGGKHNPWYNYIENLINEGNYEQAIIFMNDENINWYTNVPTLN